MRRLFGGQKELPHSRSGAIIEARERHRKYLAHFLGTFPVTAKGFFAREWTRMDANVREFL